MPGVIDLSLDPERILTFRLNDVERKNIFSENFINDFLAAMDEIDSWDTPPKVMVLQGLPDVFCAGAEKQTLVDLTQGKVAVKDLILSERLVNAEFPIIAAMEGHAMGGGLAFAFCSDIVIAARESRYGAVFMSMGFTPGMGTTTLLAEMVGPFLANEMMFTAKRFKGSELEKKSTNINYILPKDRVMDKAYDIARQIAEKSEKSVRLLKYTISAKRRHLLTQARIQEDMMHQLSFAFPETRAIIDDFYAGE